MWKLKKKNETISKYFNQASKTAESLSFLP